MELQLGSLAIEQGCVWVQHTLVLDTVLEVGRCQVSVVLQTEETSHANAEVVLLDHWAALDRVIKHDMWEDLNVTARFS